MSHTSRAVSQKWLSCSATLFFSSHVKTTLWLSPCDPLSPYLSVFQRWNLTTVKTTSDEIKTDYQPQSESVASPAVSARLFLRCMQRVIQRRSSVVVEPPPPAGCATPTVPPAVPAVVDGAPTRVGMALTEATQTVEEKERGGKIDSCPVPTYSIGRGMCWFFRKVTDT